MIECVGCDAKYIGQTKRAIEKRFEEHITCIDKKQPNKSAFAAHILRKRHKKADLNNVRVLKQVNDDRRLDAYESFYIQRTANLLNLDNGNIESALFSRI